MLYNWINAEKAEGFNKFNEQLVDKLCALYNCTYLQMISLIMNYDFRQFNEDVPIMCAANQYSGWEYGKCLNNTKQIEEICSKHFQEPFNNKKFTNIKTLKKQIKKKRFYGLLLNATLSNNELNKHGFFDLRYGISQYNKDFPFWTSFTTHYGTIISMLFSFAYVQPWKKEAYLNNISVEYGIFKEDYPSFMKCANEVKYRSFIADSQLRVEGFIKKKDLWKSNLNKLEYFNG